MIVSDKWKGFPALFAPASLKLARSEAARAFARDRFPALFAPASLKLEKKMKKKLAAELVFRRFLRRPH